TPAPAPTPAPAADVQASTNAQASGSAQGGLTLPGAAPQAAAVAGSSDHDAMVGHLAVGYLGRRDVNLGVPPGELPAPLSAPVVGVRYWLSDMLGIDAGLGFLAFGGSNEANGTSQDIQGYTAFILHGGVPLALANTGHFSFQIVPELNVGF